MNGLEIPVWLKLENDVNDKIEIVLSRLIQ